MKNTYKTILDKSSAKWILALIAVVGFVITIYTSFFKKDSPLLKYEILSKVSVFNKHDDVTSLRIFLDTLDVQQNESNITFYTIRVINRGTMHINYNMYDASDFGISMCNGKIIKEPIIVDVSNDYIGKRIKETISVKDSSFISLPLLPLDVDDYYVVRFGVYHKNCVNPEFVCEGKISGQKSIEIINLLENRPSFLKLLLGGKWYIQALRVILYGVAFVFCFIGLLYVFAKLIPDIKDKRARKKFIELLSMQQIIQKVKQDYISNGYSYISSIYDILSLSETKLNDDYLSSNAYIKNKANKNNERQLIFHQERVELYNKLLNDGYIINQNKVLKSNKAFKDSVIILYKQLQINKMLV